MSERHFGISINDILSKSHKAEIVTARHTCIHCLHRLSRKPGRKKMTIKTLGAWFGRDYSSILHAVSNVQNWRDTDSDFEAKYLAFEKEAENILYPLQ